MRLSKMRIINFFLALLLLITLPSYIVYAVGETDGDTEKPPTVAVQDIDLGDYQTEMYLGSTQLLMVTVLPLDATDQKVTYKSSNTGIATVNIMGRVSAVALGNVEISVSAGSITRTLTIEIKEKPKEQEKEETPDVRVADIEISNFKDTIKIDETVDVTATALPKDATKPDITYSSSNPKVATVSSSGQIMGKKAGKADIIFEADGIRKSMSLTVKIPTKNIEVNETYLVLGRGESFNLKAKVLPAKADQTITYKSISPSIASVSKSGVIKALRPGSCSIIVSAWDTDKIVSVIVNDGSPGKSSSVSAPPDDDITKDAPDAEELASMIAKLPQKKVLSVDGSEYRVVSTAALKELYETGASLLVNYDDYNITINGLDIKNINNELSTRLAIEKTDDGLELNLNAGMNLPGKISIRLLGYGTYSHLYLYNDFKDDYQELDTLEAGNTFSVDMSGRYILTQDKLSGISINWIVIAAIAVIALGPCIAYIAVKKRHWFW